MIRVNHFGGKDPWGSAITRESCLGCDVTFKLGDAFIEYLTYDECRYCCYSCALKLMAELSAAQAAQGGKP